MPYYGFKENPRQAVISKAKKLFGKDAKVTVTGTRLKPEQCTSMGLKPDSYLVSAEIKVANGDFVSVTANLRDWRKAYGLLVIEVENQFQALQKDREAVKAAAPLV